MSAKANCLGGGTDLLSNARSSNIERSATIQIKTTKRTHFNSDWPPDHHLLALQTKQRRPRTTPGFQMQAGMFKKTSKEKSNADIQSEKLSHQACTNINTLTDLQRASKASSQPIATAAKPWLGLPMAAVRSTSFLLQLQ
jgi:hypothetical protein